MAVDESQMTKAQLLANIEQGWNDFQNYLGSLSYERVTIPTDPAGWTAKDHIAHVAIWEDSLNALLEKQSRRQHMGIDDQQAWDNYDWDKVNAVIQQRYHDISLADLRTMFFDIHARLIRHIQALSDADLQRPYKDFEPGSTLENPVIHWLIIDTYPHYDEHKDYIGVIVKQFETLNKAQLLDQIAQGWNQLNAYLVTLSDQQLTQLPDAAGWTVKDHVIHMAIWEDGAYALLERLMRVQYIGIDEATWERGTDEINAAIQQRYQDLSWDEVQRRRIGIHERLIKKIESLSDEDLQRPYRFYETASTSDMPVIRAIIGDTFAHYADHLGWIKAIVAQSNDSSDEPIKNKAQLLDEMARGWVDFNAYLDTLTEQQVTQPTDPAGWTAKDHVAHLAVWEDGMNAFLRKQPRYEQMGVPEDVWKTGDFDQINAVIQQHNQDLSWDEARQHLRDVHQELVGRVQALTDEDLQRPFNYYQPWSSATDPAIGRLAGNTFDHYAEHQPWIDKIVKSDE